MSSSYTVNKNKHGDMTIFGGGDPEKPEIIEIEKENRVDFLTDLIEHLDLDEIEQLEIVVEDLLSEKSEDDE